LKSIQSQGRSERNPDAYPKDYCERVEKFSRNYIWRKITGEITIEFLEAAMERMFTADEVSGVVDLAKLKGMPVSLSDRYADILRGQLRLRRPDWVEAIAA
jgi:hypothetical protein